MNPRRTTSQVLSAFVGFLMLMTSVPCVAMMIFDIITQADNLSGAIGAGTFMAFIGVLGLAMVAFGLRKPSTNLVVTEAWERRALAVAQAHNGELSVAELALHSHLSVDQAAATLEHLAKRGVARPELTDAGELLYTVESFRPERDTNDAFAAFDAELADPQVELDLGADGTVSEQAAQPHYAKKDSW